MVGRGGGRIHIGRRHPEIEIQRRDLQRKVREILGHGTRNHLDHSLAADHAFNGGQHALRQLRIVGRHRIHPDDPEVRPRARRLGDVGHRDAQPLVDTLPDPHVEIADGADEFHRVGDDVVANAAMDGAERHHRRRPGQIDLTAHDHLHADDDLRRHDNGVHAVPRQRPMGLLTLDSQFESIHGGHDGPGPVADLTRAETRERVHPEDRVRLIALEQPLLQHQFRAALLTVRRTLLRRLEDEQHRSGQILPHRHQVPRHA